MDDDDVSVILVRQRKKKEGKEGRKKEADRSPTFDLECNHSLVPIPFPFEEKINNEED